MCGARQKDVCINWIIWETAEKVICVARQKAAIGNWIMMMVV
jgi:hypothetical protein